MPSLDPISTPKRPGKRARHGKLTLQQRAPGVRQPFFASDLAVQRRKRAMYVTVCVIMAALVIVWAATFRASLHQTAGTANPFSGIAQKIGDLFKGPQQPDTANTNTANQERLRELRGYVFPEFKDAP